MLCPLYPQGKWPWYILGTRLGGVTKPVLMCVEPLRGIEPKFKHQVSILECLLLSAPSEDAKTVPSNRPWATPSKSLPQHWWSFFHLTWWYISSAEFNSKPDLLEFLAPLESGWILFCFMQWHADVTWTNRCIFKNSPISAVQVSSPKKTSNLSNPLHQPLLTIIPLSTSPH